MRTITMNKEDMRDKVTEETAKFGLSIGVVMSVLIGLWGFACLFGGLVISGPGNLVKGFITAIGG